MSNDLYRDLNEQERKILLKMASAEVINREILIAQIDVARVNGLDRVGSLKFKLTQCPQYFNTNGPMITAQQEDVDTVAGFGPYINVLLFLKDGYIDELEVYKDDGSEIVSQLDPEKFTLTWGLPPSRRGP